MFVCYFYVCLICSFLTSNSLSLTNIIIADFINMNAQSVTDKMQQEREKSKKESEEKKQRDKMNLAKDKLKKDDRKDKEKDRTQKGERRAR